MVNGHIFESVPLLSMDKISLAFGGVRALDGVTLTAYSSRILGLIGPNGSGKTSLLNVVSRLYKPQTGNITFDGCDLLKTPAHKVRALGISRSFQNVRLFDGLSVLENLMVGALNDWPIGATRSLLGTPRARRYERQFEKKAVDVAEFLGISNLLYRVSGALGFGERKLVDTGRALMGRPKLLLLDEPTSGIPEDERGRITSLIADMPTQFDCGVMVVDHDVPFLFELSDHIVALDFGRVVASGSPEAVRNDEHLIAAYFGRDADE